MLIEEPHIYDEVSQSTKTYGCRPRGSECNGPGAFVSEHINATGQEECKQTVPKIINKTLYYNAPT